MKLAKTTSGTIFYFIRRHFCSMLGAISSQTEDIEKMKNFI